MRTLLCYERCSTCRKAQNWLDDHAIAYEKRKIDIANPNESELQLWQKQSGLPLAKFFNTSGRLYRELNLREKLPSMTDEEKISLLASDGMLVKRPILLDDTVVLVGFREAEWSEALL